MSNRFELKENRILTVSDRFYRWFSIIVFVAICVLFFMAVEASGRNTIEKQQASLENAIARDVVQCYSLEGRYPPSLSYIEEHYGLTYDKSTFFVDYQPIAANLYPDYTVIRR